VQRDSVQSRIGAGRDVRLAFGQLDVDWKQFVEIDKRYFRPAEVVLLRGDATKARMKLGWEPKVSSNSSSH
jgi:GDPmannose 4,6-dehydratase